MMDGRHADEGAPGVDRWDRLHCRTDVLPADRDRVRAMIAGSGFFSTAEVDIAVELVDERLTRGAASGYEFLFAEADGYVVGYACFGEIPCTVGSYDLYWIAVDPQQRGRGLGQRIFAACERQIALRDGRGLYIETSCRAQYAPTRAFYERCGCRLIAELPDFYAPGDAKAIYFKPVLGNSRAEAAKPPGAPTA